MNAPAPSTTVKSAMRTLDIIEYVVAHSNGAVAQDISGALAIPVSSLSYLLSTLVEREYLVRNGRRYFPGPGLERLATPAGTIPFEARMKSLLRALRIELNETCSFMALQGWEVEVRITEASEQALRYAIDPGTRKPLHSLASGKAILAVMPADMLDRYFAEVDRTSFTEQTIIDEQSLRAEIVRTRANGFAVARNEDQLGVVSFGCAVRFDGGKLGAVGVAIPEVRFDDEFGRNAVSRLLKIAEQFPA